MPMSYRPTKPGLVYIPANEQSGIHGLRRRRKPWRTDDPYYPLEHQLPFKGDFASPGDPVKQQARWEHDIGPPVEGRDLVYGGESGVPRDDRRLFQRPIRADTGGESCGHSRNRGPGILAAGQHRPRSMAPN